MVRPLVYALFSGKSENLYKAFFESILLHTVNHEGQLYVTSNEQSSIQFKLYFLVQLSTAAFFILNKTAAFVCCTQIEKEHQFGGE